MLHRAQPIARAAGEFAKGACAEVTELVLLQVSPDVLRRVELGSVGWQELQLNRSFETLDVIAHHLAAMRGQPIPDHEYFAADLPTQGVEELDDLRSLNRSREQSEVEAIEGDTGHRRELVPIEVILQHRGFTPRRPTPHPGRSLAQSRLVDEDYDSALFSGVFFSAGQRTRFQRRIAPSSRSSARFVGRWLLKPRPIKIRHTWLSLYRRPNFSSISWPTRRSVHSSVANPCASAPSLSSRTSSTFCCASRPEGRPRGRRLSACRPPASSCSFQVLTVLRVTSTRRAVQDYTTSWTPPGLESCKSFMQGSIVAENRQ